MAQLNLNLTPEFLADLRTLMKERGFRHQSEAIRTAVHEAVERLRAERPGFDFRDWLGIANVGREELNPKLKTDDDLWEKG